MGLCVHSPGWGARLWPTRKPWVRDGLREQAPVGATEIDRVGPLKTVYEKGTNGYPKKAAAPKDRRRETNILFDKPSVT